jgi:NADPH:quinone reductase-like Zn-dependent oxidoreductase
VILTLAFACARPSTTTDAAPRSGAVETAPTPVPMPTTMKALVIRGFGEPDVLTYEDAALPPPPNAGELRVRVHAIGINPLDHKVRAGMVPSLVADRFPFVLGWDLSGTVESIGEGVEGFAAGDEVYAMIDLHRGGAYAEYAIVLAGEVAKKPAKLDHEHAAAMPLAGLTAWQALVEYGEITGGQTVLVQGGSGGVGSFAVQIAKAKGAKVIATASGKNQDLLRELGADVAIDYETTKFETIAKDVDIVLDTVGGETLARSIGVLRKGGIVVSIVAAPDSKALEAKGARGKRMIVHPDSKALAELAALVDAGRLEPVVTQVHALADGEKAHRAVATGHTRGKIVLRVVSD